MWVAFAQAALAGKFVIGEPDVAAGTKAMSEATVKVAADGGGDGKIVDHCQIDVDQAASGWLQAANVTCKAAFSGIPADPAFTATDGKPFRIDLVEMVGNTAADGTRMDTDTWRRFHDSSPSSRIGTLQGNEALRGKWRKGQVVGDTEWVVPTFLPILPPNARDGAVVRGAFEGMPYRAPLGKFVFDVVFPVGTATITVMVDHEGRVWREDVVSSGVPAYDMHWSRSVNWDEQAAR